MLRLQTFTFNAFQENTYVIINDNKECWIVDPGMYDSTETNTFFDFISENELTPKAVVNTHAHLDHIFGVQACKDKYKIPFYLHEKELPVLNGAAGSAMLFGFQFKNIPMPDHHISEKEPLALGNETLDVRFTPGHSPGSVVFYYAPGKWLIGGDVLFNGSIGRTDLPGGNFDTLIVSIKEQVFTLPEDTEVHSGHGPTTVIGQEKTYNPFLQGI
jgi:glyoxylase-like metal-dependent hydrolase (beta-lactamase superfamily II)